MAGAKSLVEGSWHDLTPRGHRRTSIESGETASRKGEVEAGNGDTIVNDARKSGMHWLRTSGTFLQPFKPLRRDR